MDAEARNSRVVDAAGSRSAWIRNSLGGMCLLIIWLLASIQLLAFQYFQLNLSPIDENGEIAHRKEVETFTHEAHPLDLQKLTLGPSLPSSKFHELDFRRLEYDESNVEWDSTCLLTISAWNNFGFVQSFFETSKETNPKLTCHVWLVADNPDPWTQETKDMVENGIKPEIAKDLIVVTLTDIQHLVDYNLAELALRYDLVCFNTAVKPLAFEWIFLNTKANKVMYFDNDIWIMQPLTTIIGLLESHSFVVTPHVVMPYDIDGRRQDERNIAQAGIMNFGFLGLSKSDSTFKFLNWWAQRLRYYGFVDVSKGMHFDQNWADFIPIFWESHEYYVLREPEFNVAYWNMHYTGNGITYQDSVVRLHGRPVVFMHFSGTSDYRTYNVEEISRHQNRFVMSDFESGLRQVFEAYISILDTNDCLRWRGVPYGFNTFENGVEVNDVMRNYYGKVSYFANEGVDSSLFRKSVHGNPFCVMMENSGCAYLAKNTSFWDWMIDTAHHFSLDLDPSFWVPELVYQIYLLRADVRAAFPNPFGVNQEKLVTWAFANGLQEHGLSDEKLINALRDKKEIVLAHKRKRAWGLNLFGYFSDPFERGKIELMVYRSLVSSEVPTSIVQVPDRTTNSLHSNIDIYSFQQGIPFQRDANNILNFFILGPENLESFFNNYPNKKFRTHYNLALVMWDWNVIPASYVEKLAQFTEIWTLSDFTSNALRESRGWSGNTITSMKFLSRNALPHILPEVPVADRLDGAESLLQKRGIPSSAFIFLTLIDSYCEDKDNLIGATSAFMKAFPEGGQHNNPNHDEVHYLIVFNQKHKRGNSKVQLGLLEDVLEGIENVHLILGELQEAVLEGIRTRADCYLSLHSSVGFSHETLEAVMNGGIALTTDYGGHLDCIRLAPFDLGDLLVGYTPMTKHVECDFMDEEVVVAKPNLDEAARKMRYVWKYNKVIRKKIKKQLAPLARKCYGDVESNQLLNAIELLHLKVKMFSRLLEHQ